MMRPQLRSTMPSMTCFVTLKRLLRLVLMTASQSALLILRNTPSRVMPALLTRISIGPTSRVTFSNAATVESQSATLPSDAMMLKPFSFISPIQRSLRGELGPQPATTVCPPLASWMQIAVPMPPIPPVT